MDFSFDARTRELSERLNTFMVDFVYPAEPVFEAQVAADHASWQTVPIIEELKAAAKRQGLWNLFLPGEHGAGLSNLQYAPLAEILGRSIELAPVAMNCSAPDSGNMEILAAFGTSEQKAQWLTPLLEGRIRSAFAMTEPQVASSDATNISLRIERDGDSYVLNGRKWFITGAMNPATRVFIVMGKTDPSADRHRQQSMVLVPRDTSGVKVERALNVMGFQSRSHGGHAEISFTDAVVPVTSIIGEAGSGFAIAQARLGPGRIHHCMRYIGVAERAIELMCDRAIDRVAFGKPLADQGVVRQWIAQSRVKLEQLRLLVLKTAWLMDTVGNKGASTEIQAIKVATPETVAWILDKAIQVHGAGGLSQDFPLAYWWSEVRSLRFADGPDEVHLSSLARREVSRRRAVLDAKK